MTGPVDPACSPLRPVPFEITGGFWAQRRRVNASSSIPHGLSMLQVYGQKDDLRRAAGRAPGSHTGRPYSETDVYKMAEAVAWSGGPAAVVDEFGELVAAAQEESGYLNTWFQYTGARHFSDLPMGHELYCAGHLFQAAVAASRAQRDGAREGTAERVGAPRGRRRPRR